MWVGCGWVCGCVWVCVGCVGVCGSVWGCVGVGVWGCGGGYACCACLHWARAPAFLKRARWTWHAAASPSGSTLGQRTPTARRPESAAHVPNCRGAHSRQRTGTSSRELKANKGQFRQTTVRSILVYIKTAPVLWKAVDAAGVSLKRP